MTTQPEPLVVVEREGCAPCPFCKQYSHTLGTNELTAAFMHFQSMFDHRGDGIPTQYTFDAKTRDAAQVLMAAAAPVRTCQESLQVARELAESQLSLAIAQQRIDEMAGEVARLRSWLERIAAMYPDWNSERMGLVRERALSALEPVT